MMTEIVEKSTAECEAFNRTHADAISAGLMNAIKPSQAALEREAELNVREASRRGALSFLNNLYQQLSDRARKCYRLKESLDQIEKQEFGNLAYTTFRLQGSPLIEISAITSRGIGYDFRRRFKSWRITIGHYGKWFGLGKDMTCTQPKMALIVAEIERQVDLQAKSESQRIEIEKSRQEIAVFRAMHKESLAKLNANVVSIKDGVATLNLSVKVTAEEVESLVEFVNKLNQWTP